MMNGGGNAAIHYAIYIAAPPERIWAALTDAGVTRVWLLGRGIESDWRAGSTLCYRMPDGGIDARGRVVEVDPPRLVRYALSPERAGPDGMGSVISFEVTDCRGMCRLTLGEEHFGPASERQIEAARQIWPLVRSSLKTLLETGHPAEIDLGRAFDAET